MDFQITITGKTDLSGQIYRAFRTAILGGRLRAGQRLPSTRELSSQLRVARKTVLRAYDLLQSESLIEGTSGSGTRVQERSFERRATASARASVLRPRPEWLRVIQPRLSAPPEPVRFDFGIGKPDVSLFPFALWRSLLASSGRVLGPSQGNYADAQGDIRLREAISRYVAFTRAVVCNRDQIIVTRGAQQAFDLIARVLLVRGETAAIEEPGYPPVRDLFATSGIKLAPTGVDNEGLRVSELPEQARLIYVTPSHQFPLGTPMSIDRKLALLRWAVHHRACIVEDDYDSEYRFDPRPLEALQSIDRNGVVLYVGTFSKLMHPGLRIGFIVVPQTLAPALCAARRLNDSNESPLVQIALARFIEEGHLARHVRRMSKTYGRRRAALLKGLNQRHDIFGRIVPSVAGLHLTCLLESEKHVRDLLRRAQSQHASLVSLNRFSTRSSLHGLVFGYGAISEEAIVEALRRLARG